MLINKNDLHKVKQPESFKYMVFKICTSEPYGGEAYVAGETLEEINGYINAFRKDPKHSETEFAWHLVFEDDKETDLVSDEPGILCNSIHFCGYHDRPYYLED